MIKFFNKVRKGSLDENKLSKYLKYAVGEIILVMIGILLALQVNTWNTNRELKKEEQKILKSLHKEFGQNLNMLDTAYEFHLNRRHCIETIVEIDPKPISLDSLRTILLCTQRNYTYDAFQGIYNSVINSGKIELISNDLLKGKISGFQDLLMDYQEDEDGTKEFAFQTLHKYVVSEGVLDNYNFFRKKVLLSKDEEIRTKEKYIKLINSDVFKSNLTLLSGWMVSIFDEAPILREEMVSIINLLEEEIESQ